MKFVRCAIYTRKSSEEGLEQNFNSLDAQREACSAYILSQASERWSALPDRYDDGGLSGGSLDRPALQRLLCDVSAGKVDIIVVYKVDRLTRSLLDFSKLVEAFDSAGTSFVSVTQSFNTTTSMGRLTLNMLLSFAQFEREVTAERIRDKIAASKAKGMWMGGIPPLGYAPDGRSLKIVDAHAELVRDIFDRYLRLGNVRQVAEQLTCEGVVSPVRVKAKTGATFGGVPLSRGQLYGILKCPTYVGEVRHQGKVYPGLHPPIVNRETWDQVQLKLAENLRGHRRGKRRATASLLAGKLIDKAGEPLLAAHTTAGDRRYRYYVSRDRHHSPSSVGMRIPAIEIEAAVTNRVAAFFDEPVGLATLPWLQIAPPDVARLNLRASGMAKHGRDAVRSIVRQVRVTDAQLEIVCDTAEVARTLDLARTIDAPPTFVLLLEARLTRSGRVMRLVRPTGAPVSAAHNQSLVNLIAKAHRWWAVLRAGEVGIQGLAKQEGVLPAYVTRVLRLAFLSPAVTDAILAGRQSPKVNVTELTLGMGVEADWTSQQRLLIAAR